MTKTRLIRPLAAVGTGLALAVGGVAVTASPASADSPVDASARDSTARVDYVVDGDTVRLMNGVYVRLIGIDTPEVGKCGYGRAKRRLDRLVNGRVRLIDPASVDGKDHYGRLLRYVQDHGRDGGLLLLRRGLAKARYDSTDGYDHHPRQARYHRADRRHKDVCR